VSATVPPLGLSNKATGDGQHYRRSQTHTANFSLESSSSPGHCLFLASAIRGRARFHDTLARDREGLRPWLRGMIPCFDMGMALIARNVFIVHYHRCLFVSRADRDRVQGRKCKARHGSNLRHEELPTLRTASRGARPHRDTHRFQSGRPARPHRLPR
jgi:hypothetical protein